MKLNLSTGFLVATIVVAFTACAQTKKSSGNSSKDMKLLEATKQKLLPGVPGGEIEVKYRFVVIWKTSDKPETFFWRGEDGWLNCEVNKVHKNARHQQDQNGEELWYTSEQVSFDNVKKGDTLELIPVTGGKFPIPEEIPETAKNTIYYKTVKTKTTWLSLPVKTIKKMPSIAMP